MAAPPSAPRGPKVLCIDTRFRDNYYGTQSTDMQMTLPLRLKGVTSMMLTSAEIPFCFNTFSRFNKNNYFHISRPGALYKIVIQDGQYSATQAQDLITLAIAAVLAAAGDPDPIFLEVAYPSARLVFNSLVGFALHFGLQEDATTASPTVDQTPLQLQAGWTLGFRLATYEGSAKYLTEGVYDPQTPRYIYLTVDDYNQGGSDFVTAPYNSSLFRDSIMAKLPLRPDSQGRMLVVEGFDLSPYHKRHYVATGVNIQKLRIRLVDEFGRIVDLSNMDYSLTLQFEVAR